MEEKENIQDGKDIKKDPICLLNSTKLNMAQVEALLKGIEGE